MTTRHQRVALLDRYLRIPTISRQVTASMTDAVRGFWREQGLELELLLPADGAGTPALFGQIDGPAGAPTVLLYGHYDVQPTGDLALWRWQGVACDPFVPSYFLNTKQVEPKSLADDEVDDLLVVARGGADNKGQHLANVLGALDAARAGTLQWRVKIVLDGEEEHGSPNLLGIAKEHRQRLAADLLIGSDGPKQQNRPTLLLGVRGLLMADIVASNSAPASLHSGNYGNIVPNPALPLAHLIETISSRVRDYAAEHDRFRRDVEMAFAGRPDAGISAPFLWPTVNVNHLQSEGASPELTRTIIPRSVHARIDVRLTPDTPPGAVRSLIEAAVAEQNAAAEGIQYQLSTGGDLPASFTSPGRPEFDWLLRLLGEESNVRPVVLPILGGTLPNYVFTDCLSLPAFWLPAANSDNQQHDINEHYLLRHFFQQIGVYLRIVSSRPSLP